MQIIIQILVNALALLLAAFIVPGVAVGGDTGEQVLTAVVVGAIFGLINAVLKPIMTALALPLMVLTLGLFVLVVNALLFLLTGWLAGELGLAFTVDGFWAALLGAIVVSIVSVGVRLAFGDTTRSARVFR